MSVIAFCRAPSDAAAQLIVQDDLDAFVQVLLCSSGFFPSFCSFFIDVHTCNYTNSLFTTTI